MIGGGIGSGSSGGWGSGGGSGSGPGIGGDGEGGSGVAATVMVNRLAAPGSKSPHAPPSCRTPIPLEFRSLDSG